MIITHRNQRLLRYSQGGCGKAATAATPAASWSAARLRRRVQNTAEIGFPNCHLKTELEQQSTVLQSLTPWAAAELPRYMPPPGTQWQPADLLPDSTSSNYMQQVAALREEARCLPSDVLVVLAGLAVAAATVPNQLSQWCGTLVLQDSTGADQQTWAAWHRNWAGSCNKHRQLLLSYCYLSGCFDMQSLERSMHEAIGTGSEVCSQLPYQQLIGRVLQARMTRVMHTNLAGVASYHGATGLARIATAIATDEGRHEVALVSVVSQLFELDPEGAVKAFADVVQHGVTLPAVNMDDGWHETGNAPASPYGRQQRLHSSSSSSHSTISGRMAAEVRRRQQQQEPQNEQVGQVQLQAAAAGSADMGLLHRRCSQLYLDFMAVADAVGVWTVNDIAAAVEQCVKVWKVTQLPTRHLKGTGDGSNAAAMAVQLLVQQPSMLRRLSELQLVGKLQARRKDKLRSACFSWVFKREVALN